MAKLKYEFLSNYFKANGLPRRNRIFGNIAKYSALGSRFAPLSNWLASSPIGKLVSNHFLGVHPKRSLPGFASQTFPRWFRSRRAKGGTSRRSGRGHRDGRPAQRHLHELQLPGCRQGRGRPAGSGGLQGRVGRRALLRPAHDFQGDAGRRRRQRRPQRGPAPRLCRAGHPDHRLRAQLLADAPRRVSRIGPGPQARTVAENSFSSTSSW